VSNLPPLFRGIIDDAAIFPPGNVPLADALTAYDDRSSAPYADLVASFVVTDLRLPDVVRSGIPLSVVITGGAGSVGGVCGLVRRADAPLAGIEIALRDLDDPVGNTRRIGLAVRIARDEGTLDDETPVYVELPHVANSGRWLEAADVVAEHELRLKFRTGGLEAELFPHPHALGRWIEAALDRETPFKCTAGLHNAVAHTDPETGFEHHGFLNILAATEAALAGSDVPAVLAERDAATVADLAGKLPDSTRRWFTSFGSCSVLEPVEDLVNLGLVDAEMISTGSISDE